MLKHILLLTPVYVTIFWSINLHTSYNKNISPRLFLGKFMLFATVIYISHLIYFLPSPDFYIYIDPFYQYASLMVFPLYHIYFRLLTIDDTFSIKKHYPYLIIPTLLFILYTAGAIITPIDVFKNWVYNRFTTSETQTISYLKIVYIGIKVTFLIQVILIVISNSILLKKFGDKALQYYSDISDSSTIKVRLLNLSMIITGISSIILGALGRNFFENEIISIGIASVIFSSMLFIIGWLGDKQKTLNPTTISINKETKTVDNEEQSALSQQRILENILTLFSEQKVYLDSSLTIQEIAQSVGTNRTYVSTLINQNFNQNFCSFVNDYRVDAVKNMINNHPEYSNQILAENCGFGSVDSLKRAVKSNTNMTLADWKNQLISNS